MTPRVTSNIRWLSGEDEEGLPPTLADLPPRPPPTLVDMMRGWTPGGRVNLGVLGPEPTTMETVGALAPLAGAALFAPSLPLAMAAIPAYHYLTSGKVQELPSIPSMPGEPWATIADLTLGIGGGGQAGGPKTAAVRYRRPGVSAAARAAAEKMHRAPVSDPIGERGAVFHATDPSSAERILMAGEIVPDPSELRSRGLERWQDLARLKPVDPRKPAPPELFAGLVELARNDPKVRRELNELVAFREYGSGIFIDQPHRIAEALDKWIANPKSVSSPGRSGNQTVDFARAVWGKNADKVLASLGYTSPSAFGGEHGGVSVSRVPRVASKGSKAISFMIDPEKMPPSRPYAESGYEKTLEGAQNPRFEFENRTYNQPIPVSAIREMWADKFFAGDIGELRGLAERYNLPLREFGSGREMHRSRAGAIDRLRERVQSRAPRY